MYYHLHLETIDSTNEYVKLNYMNLPNFSFVTADFQSSGKGQFDRHWYSEEKSNFLCSILLKNIRVDQLVYIKTLIVKVLKDYFKSKDIASYFKIPNDLYVNDNKIAGILIESQTSEDILKFAVIGIGININQFEFKSGLKATSLAKECNQKFDLEKESKLIISNIYDMIKNI